MKKSLLLIFLSVFFIAGLSETSYAQNPKQTKKHKKKAKKKKTPKDEPIDYVPRRKEDNDGDGVPNLWDHCPNTPEGTVVTEKGCPPDTDGDGIFDSEDNCINEPGPRSNGGCPELDSDGDGILDKNDMCPDVAGEAKFYGCPDRDGDGVQDSEDNCPDVPGLIGLHGCPKQAEDSDGDGLYNHEDKCPFVAGPADNHGCPEFTDAEKAILEAAFNNLLFKTNSDVIELSSYESLNQLASLMENNAACKLYLEGHTDNVGDDNKNMILSQKRARSVKQYLVEAGVEEKRITTAGFGETRPVVSNDTPEGRTQNRRVVMELGF
ncbi:OmpA family protein [Cyclobacteriaceae bacterium]|nr:OmpA family protein [Cyclobacteriaceae bacterium]